MERSFRTNLIDAIMDQASQDEKIVVLNADSARALCLTKFAETYPDLNWDFVTSLKNKTY